MKKILAVLFIVFVLSSCSEYQKALKSDDLAIKFEAAEKMYDKQKYEKAIRLFEQIAPSYRGKPQAEKLFYIYSQALYKTKQYYAAGYQFESFASSYPKSEKIEETSYLGAVSFSKLSPVYSLDQVDTYKAIEKFQAFIDQFPESIFLPEANANVKSLREKLEKKAFEVAKQYNTISDFKSAIVVLDNFIIDYPGTPYKEKALFWKFDSTYQLAINSVNSKMKERLIIAKLAYANLVKFNPNSEFKTKADGMLARIETDLKQF
jgi:outer membrane protein assembly factor BamD